MGEGLLRSARDGDKEPGEDAGEDWAEAISRYQRRQEMFSRRRPSLSDSLHLVNTLFEEVSSEEMNKASRRYAHIQRPHRASSPSKSLTTSAATDKIGDGKEESIVSRMSRMTERNGTARERERNERESRETDYDVQQEKGDMQGGGGRGYVAWKGTAGREDRKTVGRELLLEGREKKRGDRGGMDRVLREGRRGR